MVGAHTHTHTHCRHLYFTFGFPFSHYLPLVEQTKPLPGRGERKDAVAGGEAIVFLYFSANHAQTHAQRNTRLLSQLCE